MRQHRTLGWRSLAFHISTGLLAVGVGCGTESDDALPVQSFQAPEAFTDQTNPLELIKYINNSPSLKADDLAPPSDIGRTFSVPDDALPFSASYWPMKNNGILARWQGRGSLSPAEKYGTLFLDRAEQRSLYDWIRQNQGSGVPNVRLWFGICHGWAASAVVDKAPQHKISVRRVERGGTATVEECGGRGAGCITVTPGDITALLAEAYSAPDARYIGERCDTAPSRFRYDSSGRIIQPNCRANAGTLFLIATHFIKQNRRSFVMSVTNNAEIWNQPVYAYRLDEYRTIARDAAVDLIDPQKRTYDFNPAAVGFRHVTLTMRWAQEAQPTVDRPPPLLPRDAKYEFVLELDANGAVLGGEWVGRNKKDHPPFYWYPVAPGTEAPNFTYANVKKLLDLSRN